MSSKQGMGQVSIHGSSGKRALSRLAAYLKVTAAIVALLSNNAALAQQLPTGGSVAAGSAAICSPQNGTLNINQSSNQAVINWNSFSVGRGGTVNFNQPNSSSATLNRVTGSTPSWIGGTINAPGTVLLVNPNGIAITKSGVINTGSFAASTLDISNADFMAGKYKFTGNGGSAAVRNSGRINVSDGGFAALLGGQVANDGVISARLGKVGLGAGELITLDLAGDGFLSVAVPSSQVGKLVDSSGALVSNKGKIRADGGSVFLTAATASNILRDAVNVPGSIRANTVGTHNGRIVIGGGDGNVSVTGKLAANGNSKRNGGKIEVSGANVSLNGKISANGKNGGTVTVASSGDLSVAGKVEAKGNDGQGGRIDLTGANIKVVGALIDASGTTGGGLVRIGGTFQGGNGDPNDPLYQSFIGRFGALPAIASAQTVTIDAGTTIDVSAKSVGDAGTAIVWSEQITSFAGTIIGKGGSSGGNGGFAEVSGKQLLDFTGKVDLLAASGTIGTLLLDPYNVVIVPGTGGVFTATQDSTLGADTLTAALAGANVTVSAGTGGAGTGNITLRNDVALSWNSTTTLTLDVSSNVAGTITLNGSITANAGGLNLKAGTDSGAITATGAISVNIFTLTSGYWTQNAASMPGGVLPTFSANDFRFGSFKTTGGYFLRVAGGDGTTANPYQIADIYGLQGLRSEATGGPSIGQLTHAFVLINDINASGTANWNSGAGFAPIGSNTGTYSFTGSFDGQGHTISGLRINLPTTDYVGLFGLIQTDSSSSILSASVKNLTLTGANITGQDYTGGIIGSSDSTSATYSGLSFSGTVTGRDSTGGLIGQINAGTVSSSSSSGTVSDKVSGRSSTGGLVGTVNSGTIQQSFSSLAVTASGVATGTYAGGLVGYTNSLTVIDSYATGSVTASSSLGTAKGVGGLVGYMAAGSIQRAYATGNVVGYLNVGGLVGDLIAGSISQSYATGTVAAASTGPVGGLVGYSKGAISQSYATGAVSGINGAFAGGLVGETATSVSTIADSYALGSVMTATGTGAGAVGGLVGWVDADTGSITRSYSAGAVSGGASQSVGGLIGVNKISSANVTTRITFNYFDYQAAGVSSTAGVGSLNGSVVTGIAAGNVAGMTTSALQSALPAGFSTSTWTSIAGNYPLLLSQPGFVAGTVYDTYGGSAVANTTVSILINGSVSTAQTDGSGAYMIYLGSSGIAAGTDVFVYTSGGGVSFVHTSGKSASGLNLYAGYLSETSSNATSSGIATELASALAGNSTLLSQVSGLSNYVINATAGAFNIDAAIGSGAVGTLVLLSSGTVTQSAAISATNLLLQGTGATYTLTNAANNVANLTANTTGSVSLTTGSALALGASTVGGTLSVSSGGAIAQSGILTVTGTSSFSVTGASGGITLGLNNKLADAVSFDTSASSGNATLVNAMATKLGASNVGGNLSVTGTTGTITQTAALTVTGTSSFANSASGSAITLSNTGNLFTGAVSLNTLGSGAATLTNNRATILGTSSVGGALTVTDRIGNLTQNGVLTVGTTSSFTVSAAGASINLSTSTYQLTGAVTLSTGTNGGAASLTNGKATSLAVATVGGDLTVTDTVGNLSFAALIVKGNLSATASTGNIVQTGLLTVTGASAFTTSATDATITLTQNNKFTGAVSFYTSGTNGNASLTNNQATVLGVSTIGGGLTVIDSTGSLTQNGVLTVAGTSSFRTSASNATMLLNSNNLLTGAITLNTTGSSGAASLTNARATALAASTVGGALSVTSTGDLTINGVVTGTGGATLVTAGNLTIGTSGQVAAGSNANVVLSAAGNFINNRTTGNTAISVSGTGRWLVYSAGPDNDFFNGLNSNNTAVWGTTYPTSVSAAGNRYVFALAPVLTVTTTGTLTKTYGDDLTAAVAASGYTITGLRSGVANAFLSDTAAAYSGTAALTSAGAAATANASSLAYSIVAAIGSLASNAGYSFAFVNNGTLTVNKATLTATANAASRDYGDANPALSGSITGFKNGQSASDFGGDVWTTSAGLTTNAGTAGITGGLTNTASNYTITQTAANATALTINKATLTFTANAASRDVGTTNPPLSGSITGFKNGQTASAFGGDVWTSPADLTSPAGSYAVTGGLTNASPNYRLVQVAANLTALTVNALPPTPNTNGGTTPGPINGNNPSQFNPPTSPSGPKDVNISFQNQGTGPISVSFTPPAPPVVRVSTAPASSDVEPAALPAGQNLSGNNGLSYPPISQFDPNQYSQFKTADWAAQAGEATVFVMIARGVDREHAADAFVDGFWTGTSGGWTPPQSFAGKVTFSDGAGNAVNPTGNAGFPVTAGATDFAQLLKSGPVMIGDGATPAHWLLATQLTPDGKGIVANDPASGKQIVLNYDAATKTVGGVTSVFDANSNKFVPFAEASAGTPALAGLQSFVPSTFLAVTPK